MANNKKSSLVKNVALGAGVVALAAAGYLLFGPKGKANRKAIKGWTVKAKGEILEGLEKLQDVTKDKYDAIVSSVAKKYAKVKDVLPDEVANFEKEALKHWKSIERDLGGKKAKVKKVVNKVKKAVKKAK